MTLVTSAYASISSKNCPSNVVEKVKSATQNCSRLCNQPKHTGDQMRQFIKKKKKTLSPQVLTNVWLVFEQNDQHSTLCAPIFTCQVIKLKNR